LLILLSNDDGVDSEGIQALREALAATDEVWVVAPEAERTCISHAVTLHKPLRIRDLGERVFSTNGTPADAVLLALRVVMPRKPDLLISGINKGPNMGQDVSYSGTVAAAKEGAFTGITSLAVSLNGRDNFLFGHAARSVLDIVEKVRTRPFPLSTLLNVNIPNVPYEEIKGIMVTSLGKRIYNGNIVERTDPRGGTYYWIGGDGEEFEAIEGTDLCAVDQGYLSLTPLHLDFTSYLSLDKFKTIFSSGGHHEEHTVDP
jgi:5'-nucleotidase